PTPARPLYAPAGGPAPTGRPSGLNAAPDSLSPAGSDRTPPVRASRRWVFWFQLPDTNRPPSGLKAAMVISADPQTAAPSGHVSIRVPFPSRVVNRLRPSGLKVKSSQLPGSRRPSAGISRTALPVTASRTVVGPPLVASSSVR